jgi:hypothetical protein
MPIEEGAAIGAPLLVYVRYVLRFAGVVTTTGFNGRPVNTWLEE